MKRLASILLLLAVAFALPGCGSLTGLLGIPTQQSDECKWSTPRAYVACMDKAVAQVAKDFTDASRANRLPKDQFLAAEPALDRCYAALKDAGGWMRQADEVKAVAMQGPEGAERQAKLAAAGAVESIGLGRAAACEADLTWLKDTLARATAPPPPGAAIAPTPLTPKLGG